MKRFSNKPVPLSRLLRLMSALLRNPHLNLSPKPHLSHLVTALLTLILAQDQAAGQQNVSLASSSLALALARWATPVNQLQCQTLKHLREFVLAGRGSLASQCGALTCLTRLGGPTLCETLHPWPAAMNQQLEQLASRPRSGSSAHLWAALRQAGAALLHHWLEGETGAGTPHCTPDWRLYSHLYSHFGPSLVQEVPRLANGRAARPRPAPIPPARIRIRKLQWLSGRGREERGGPGEDKERPSLEPALTASQNFDILADLGVPSDLFEPDVLERRESVEVGPGGDSAASAAVIPPSSAVLELFPRARPVRPRPVPLTISLPLSRAWPRNRLRRGGPGAGAARGSGPAWRQLVSGGRVGAVHRRADVRKVDSVPDYCDLLMFA